MERKQRDPRGSPDLCSSPLGTKKSPLLDKTLSDIPPHLPATVDYDVLLNDPFPEVKPIGNFL